MEKFNAKVNQAMWSVYFKLQQMKNDVKEALSDNEGDAYIDTVVKILIAVVIGSILLYALITIMGNQDNGVIGNMSKKINEMFGKAVSQ